MRRATHEVTADPAAGVVVKRFRSWARGEPAREWAALTLLAERAPGLAPHPVRAALTADPPEIVMSWLPGVPLGEPVTPAQAVALAAALGRLWRAAPGHRGGGPGGDLALNSVALANQVRSMLAASEQAMAGGPAGGPAAGSAARQAWTAAGAWLRSGGLDRVRVLDDELVLGQGDGNLANFLWDGTAVTIVDFEDSGPSDRAFELATLAEHLAVWSDAGLDADSLLARFTLTGPEQARLREYRRLAGLYWLLVLLPGGPASARNPPGTLGRQAARLLALLG
jgi:aminoglycoside phosphotransferase